MGFTRPFPNPIRVNEDAPRISGASPLYVMPAADERLSDDYDTRFPAKRGKLLNMPSRWTHPTSLAPSGLSYARQHFGNTVECWPRGYPNHDDL